MGGLPRRRPCRIERVALERCDHLREPLEEQAFDRAVQLLADALALILVRCGSRWPRRTSTRAVCGNCGICGICGICGPTLNQTTCRCRRLPIGSRETDQQPGAYGDAQGRPWVVARVSRDIEPALDIGRTLAESTLDLVDRSIQALARCADIVLDLSTAVGHRRLERGVPGFALQKPGRSAGYGLSVGSKFVMNSRNLETSIMSRAMKRTECASTRCTFGR